MKLHELSPVEGSKKNSKRIGRGHGSGWGKTAGKGHKGQKARSGGGVRPGFEGGQMPLQRRLPKRGFNNIFAKNVVAINLSTLNRKFDDGATVDIEALVNAGVVKNGFDAVIPVRDKNSSLVRLHCMQNFTENNTAPSSLVFYKTGSFILFARPFSL